MHSNHPNISKNTLLLYQKFIKVYRYKKPLGLTKYIHDYTTLIRLVFLFRKSFKRFVIGKILRFNSQHFIFFVTYDCVPLARVFVPGKPFQPSGM